MKSSFKSYFGFCVIYESENVPRFTFSTKEYLSDAQLYLYAYRVYDPIAGRWTQRDPIDYQDSINLYQFCGNNPVNIFDFFGLASVNLHDPKSPQSKAADKNGIDPNFTTVEGHGNANTFIDSRSGKPSPISPKDLAELIKKAPDYDPKKPIMIQNCKTGKKDDGPAARLSEYLPNDIYAPTTITITKIHADKNGNITGSTTQADKNQGGYYRAFNSGFDAYTQHPKINSVPIQVTSQ